MNRKQNAEQITAYYDFGILAQPEVGEGPVPVETRYVGVARGRHAQHGPRTHRHRWVAAPTESEAFEELGTLALGTDWKPEALYDLDSGALTIVAVEIVARVSARSERPDHYANPCAVIVHDGHWPATTDGWMALGFSASQAEQLVKETKPELPDADYDRFAVEWSGDGWLLYPIAVSR